MALSTKITLTVSDYDIKLSRNLKFYENDQLKLIFTLNYWGIDNANGVTKKVLMPLNALSAILFIETPLGVDSIESATIEENVVTFYLTSNQTQYIGISRMQIQLSDADGCQITLPPMEFEVRENIYDDEVILSQVLLADENENVVVDENGNAINTGTQVSAQTYAAALSAEDRTATTTSQPTKQIKNFNLKTDVNGEENLLIQDSDGVTKRIKASEFLNVTPSLDGYATETFVINKIAEASLSGGEVDLSGYATKDELSTKADKTAIPTKVSQLTNDTGYLTSHQDISGKADKSYVDTELAKKSNASHTHSYNDLTDKPTIPIVPTNVSSFTNDAGYLSSSIIKSIVVVDALPEVEVEGVLYLVRGGTSTDTPTTPEEPTVTNLYPNQTRATTSDGFTITFTGRNVTIDGRNDTKSVQCQTNQFDMALEANKAYYLKLTNVSGLFDDSKRVSQSDGMICMVALTVYDSSGTSKNLINWDERDASGIYEKFTFTPSSACVKGKLIIQAKKLTSFSNWTCSIVIAEEGV